MIEKKRKWVQRLIVFMLVIAMLLPMTAPVSVQAAENDLYLAYQEDEFGTTVTKLKKAQREAYKVTELNMNKGNCVDLCFINAALSWDNARWTSDNKKVATVNGDGVITAVGEGVAKITLTYDFGLFSEKEESASVTVYVGKDNWKLHIGTTANDIPESRELKVGRKFDLAFWGVSDWNGGKLFEVEWMSSDENILSVDKSTGVITALKPGTAKVDIYLYNKASNITVNDTIEVKVLPKAYSDNTWQNENYLTYGENYFRLFSGDYMYRIPGSILDKHVLKEYGRIAETPSGGAITESYYNAVSKLSGLDKFLMGTFEFLQNGTSITINAVAGGGATYEESKMYACILRFVEELHKNENSINAIVSDAAGTTEILNSIYSEAVDLSKSEMIEIFGESKYLTETEIKEMVNELYKNYDLIGDLVSEGVTITEYIGSTMRLHEVDEAVLYLLSQCTSNGSSINTALNVLYRERGKNGVAACAEKYLSNKAADVINGIISKGTGGASKAIIKAAGKVEEILHLDMDSYYAAVEYSCYQAELRYYCKGLLREINENFNSYTEEELKDKIEAYEFAYEAYITASRMMLEEALKIAKSAEKGKVQASINALETFDYNSAVDLAMKYFKLDNPKANEHEKVFAVPGNSSEESTARREKTQYGYYHYTDGKGDYAVCAYYGQETDGWKNIYREEIWVDEPLELISTTATSLKHPEVSSCKAAGCLDGDFWNAGGRYIDENGVLWYREQTRVVGKDVAEAQKKTVIKEELSIAVSDSITLAEGTRYSFKNVSSKWHMNVKSAGKSNGTQINLWPLDMSEPNTQCYTITIVSAEEKSFMISPVCAPDMYIDVRRGGNPLAATQLISLWEADGDTTKEIVIEMLEDGSCYLTFRDNRGYCIGAKSETAAETKQTQLVVCKKTGAAEQRWYLCDENGTILGKKQEVSQNTSAKDAVLQAKMEELFSELLRANKIDLKNDDVKEAYFTTTAKAVADPGADECYNDAVIKTNGFMEVFFKGVSKEDISADNFPKHWGQKAEGNHGYSCHGFACFAQWYLYKEKNTDKIISKGRVATGTYTKEFLQNNLQVGDVIRVKIYGDVYHSMIFHSFTDCGIKVLDCNFGGTNMVRIGEVTYTHWKKTCPVYIYRVQE
ncbi:MAG: Ig-like domain-containing protein [Lachnospiraceae bacterium]|nr:Ig-like domain-containing protein [Lachnospiraceae bacterium]